MVEKEIGALWFGASIGEFKKSGVGMFTEILYPVLWHNYSANYQISNDFLYCD
jgi:hypothetical protein